MDVDDLERLEDQLEVYLARFNDCFARRDTRAHLTTYVRGQLSDLDAKSVEPIALRAGTPVRTLQEFLAQHRWDEDALRQRLMEIVRDEHITPNTVGIIDETSDVKKGDKTPGVQRQWCGKVGKTENSIVTVHLAAASEDFHCMVDGELFLPESWSEDRDRCAAAGIPDEMVHRPKWRIAVELLDRSGDFGITWPWITADEGEALEEIPGQGRRAGAGHLGSQAGSRDAQRLRRLAGNVVVAGRGPQCSGWRVEVLRQQRGRIHLDGDASSSCVSAMASGTML